jgi:hypothetical protein
MRNDSSPIVPTPQGDEEKSSDSVELMGIEPTASRVRWYDEGPSLSVARLMGPGIDVFARVMGPPNRQGHGARVAGDRILNRQGHGASRSPGSWGQPVS